MPGVAVDIQALIKNDLSHACFSTGRRIGTAAFIRAARVEAEMKRLNAGLTEQKQRAPSVGTSAALMARIVALAEPYGLQITQVTPQPSRPEGAYVVGELRMAGDIVVLAAPEIGGLPYVISGLVAAGGLWLDARRAFRKEGSG